MIRSIKAWFRNDPANWLWVLYILAAIAITLRNLLLTSGDVYTHYNNFIIFRNSFFHWLQLKDLYASYPAEQYDLFKYSPFFAMFFGLLAYLPVWLGLMIWNILNLSVMVVAIRSLSGLSRTVVLVFGFLLLQETITSTMNSQSNVLLAGLFVLAWINLEKGMFLRAALFICLTVFIKIFGILLFLLFLFYPKWWRGVIPAAVFTSIMLLLPAVSGGFEVLLSSYESYIRLLQSDHSLFVKYSVMGWLQSWFGIVDARNAVLFVGLFIQLIVHVLVLRKTQNTFQNRTVIFSTWLIWMVIFNHMAESATFIIAVAGVLIWFFFSTVPKSIRLPLLVFVIAFTCFGPSDLYPPELREKIVVDWQLKVFPCILVWVTGIGEIIFNTVSSSTRPQRAPL